MNEQVDSASIVFPSPRASQVKNTLESLSRKDPAGLCFG